MTDPIQPLSPSLLMQHAPGLRALVRRLVLDDSRVDDVLQETWLVALESPPRSQAALGSWLRTVASRLAYKTTRNDHHRSHHESRAARDEPSPSASDIVEREMARRRVVDAVLELREPYQATILHRFLENQSAQEIAARFDLPVETVRTRVKRGIEQLRRILDERHNGDYRRWHQSLILLTTLPVGTITQVAAATTLFGLSLKTLWLGAAALLTACLFGYAGWALWPATTLPAKTFTVQFTADDLSPSDAPELLELNPDESSALNPASERDAVVIPADHSPHLTLEGRIVDAAARPVAGADVSLFLWPGRGAWYGGRGRRSSAGRGRFRVERSVRTGPDGIYRFEGPAFEQTALVISVQHAEYAPVIRRNQWHVDEGALQLPNTVVDSGQQAFGRVVNALGLPLATARVSCRPLDATAFVDPVDSDVNGGFHFRHLPSGRFQIEARTSEGLRISRVFESSRAFTTTDCGTLIIPDGVRVTGRVLDRDNNPIAGVKVRAQSMGKTSGFSMRGWRGGRDGASSISDREGYYSILLAEAGSILLEAEHPRFVHVRERAQITRDSQAEAIILSMEPCFSITGRVRDQASGSPLPRFSLQVQRSSKMRRGLRSFRRTADKAEVTMLGDGEFRIDGVEPGSYYLTVTAPGSAKAQHGPFDWTGPSRVELQTEQGTTISGSIVDAADQQPMPDALIWLRSLGQGSSDKRQRSRTQTKTDQQGQFRFGAQLAGAYEIEVQVNDRPSTVCEINLSRAPIELEPLSIELGTTVFGTVRGFERGRRAVVSFRHASGNRHETTLDPSSGAYELHGLEEGSWTVDILPRDTRGEYGNRYSLLDSTRQDLILNGTGKRRFDPSVQVYGSLHGRVRLNGEAGTELAVRLRKAGAASEARGRTRPITSPTGPAGDFRFDAIPQGSYVLEIFKRGDFFGHRLGSQEVKVQPGHAQRIDPSIHTWPLSITITGPSAGVQLTLSAAADRETSSSRRRFGSSRRWTAKRGQLTGQLPTGRWQYQLTGPGITTRKGSLELSQALDLIWDPRTESAPKNR